MASTEEKCGCVFRILALLMALVIFALAAFWLWPGSKYSSVHQEVRRLEGHGQAGTTSGVTDNWEFDFHQRRICEFWVAGDTSGNGIQTGKVFDHDIRLTVDGDSNRFWQLSNRETPTIVTVTKFKVENFHPTQLFFAYKCVDPVWGILLAQLE
jgi:hypothetical protein